MTIDLEQLEGAIKLAVKYQLEELVLADGTKIVKKVYLGKPMPKKKEIVPPVNTGWTNEQALYLATPAPPLTSANFNPFVTSKV